MSTLTSVNKNGATRQTIVVTDRSHSNSYPGTFQCKTYNL